MTLSDSAACQAPAREVIAMVLVFVPKEEFGEFGEDALNVRCDPFYPHYEELEFGEVPELPAHTSIGKVECITFGGMFRDVLRGGVPQANGPGRLGEAEAWSDLPDGATCFAIITAEGFWIECFEAESVVLCYRDGESVASVNAPARLSRLQVKWRAFVHDYARRNPDQVAAVGEAVLRPWPRTL